MQCRKLHLLHLTSLLLPRAHSNMSAITTNGNAVADATHLNGGSGLDKSAALPTENGVGHAAGAVPNQHAGVASHTGGAGSEGINPLHPGAGYAGAGSQASAPDAGLVSNGVQSRRSCCLHPLS